MAEGTRLRVLDEHVQSLEQRLQDLSAESHQKLEELSERIEAMEVEELNHYEALRRDSAHTTKKLEQLMELLTNLQHPTASRGTAGSSSHDERGILPTPSVQVNKEDVSTYQLHSRTNLALPFPQLDFPTSAGENPRTWVRRCERYFEIYNIKDTQKLELATLHLDPRVYTWFHGYLAENGVVNWEAFARDVCQRFESNGMKDIVEEFNKLMQQGTVEEYQEQFEELRSRLLGTKSQFTPEYFLSSFLSGLKEEVRTAVKMLNPNSLTQAFELARLQEQNLLAIMRKNKAWLKSQGGAAATNPQKWVGSTGQNKTGDTSRNYPSRPSAERGYPNRQLIEQRRAARLCFKCGDKYSFGHQCKAPGVHTLKAVDEVVEVYDEESLRETEEWGEPEEEEEEETGLSVHALSGENPQETIRLRLESG